MIKSFNGKTPQIHPTAFVSETAYIVGEVTIGEKASIWPGAVIRGDFGSISIGKNTAIEDNCIVHSWDCIIGDNVLVGHGAVIHCKSIGNGSMVGINAVVLQGAEIGEKCFIAAGALITPNTKIPPGSLVMGSPAKVKEKLSQEKLSMMLAGNDAYVQLGQQYKQQGL
ncbi:MAG: gamma carbonic anhydrase family protein [Chloroflexi bacterium]|nr:gamma carbonic anhydrase family protein [Chloroflexota bacterium]